MGHFHNSIPHKTSSITSDWAFHSQEGRGRVETQIQRAEDACRRWMDRLSDFPVVWIIGISEFNQVKPCTRQSDRVHIIINAALWRTQTKGIKNMSSGRWFQEGRRTTPSPSLAKTSVPTRWTSCLTTNPDAIPSRPGPQRSFVRLRGLRYSKLDGIG